MEGLSHKSQTESQKSKKRQLKVDFLLPEKVEKDLLKPAPRWRSSKQLLKQREELSSTIKNSLGASDELMSQQFPLPIQKRQRRKAFYKEEFEAETASDVPRASEGQQESAQMPVVENLDPSA